jgi:L-ascorbate metabolism protein UlaG (beta-lactamase superfamily)
MRVEQQYGISLIAVSIMKRLTHFASLAILIVSLLSPLTGQVRTLPEIQSNLLNNPPVGGDPTTRKLSILDLDKILKNDSSRTAQSVFNFYTSMVDKVKEEMKDECSGQVAVWIMYNHGFIVKTAQMVFAFDLIDGYKGWVYSLPDEIVNQINVLFISHEHIDHKDNQVIKRIKDNNGYVVCQNNETKINGNVHMEIGDTITLLGLQIVAHDMLHSVPGRIFEVTCPNGMKFLHTGDNQTSLTLPVVENVDFLLLNGWVNESGTTSAVTGMRRCIDKIKPGVMIPGHFQELSHDYHPYPASRALYEWGFKIDDVPIGSSVFVMAWGEQYTCDEKHPAPPIVYAEQHVLINKESLEVRASFDGMIYLVPENTPADPEMIREAALHSTSSIAWYYPVNMPVSGLARGTYWLIGIDAAGTLSEPVSIEVPLYLQCNATEYSINSGQNSTANISISSTTDWTVSGMDSWLHASETTGSGDATITLTADENASFDSRADTLTVSGTGVPDLKIIVTQLGIPVILSVSESIVSLEATAGSETSFDITSNTDWTIAGVADWLSASDTIGSGDATITLTAVETNTNSPRLDSITVSATGAPDQIVIVAQVATGLKVYEAARIQMYPNPTDGKIIIESDHPINATIEITTLNGKLVRQEEIEGTTCEIDMRSLNEGIYIVTLRPDALVWNKKILKQ